jgi:hypothetical protein
MLGQHAGVPSAGRCQLGVRTPEQSYLLSLHRAPSRLVRRYAIPWR